jgi:pyrroloquinoline quinone (PQQ) biosynthesis protein C
VNVDNRKFVRDLISEIIIPGSEKLMDSRYFSDLRAGRLSIRQLQGFAIQHYIHNLAVLKGFALSMVKNADQPDSWAAFADGFNAEVTHPEMAKNFGIFLGLTEADFERANTVYECRAHTAAVVHGFYLGSQVENLTSALSNETMVQRYSEEFNTYLRKEYGFSGNELEFFVVHSIFDVEHTAKSADALGRLLATDVDRDRSREMALHMARFKLAKFDGIYDAYAL